MLERPFAAAVVATAAGVPPGSPWGEDLAAILEATASAPEALVTRATGRLAS